MHAFMHGGRRPYRSHQKASLTTMLAFDEARSRLYELAEFANESTVALRRPVSP